MSVHKINLNVKSERQLLVSTTEINVYLLRNISHYTIVKREIPGKKCIHLLLYMTKFKELLFALRIYIYIRDYRKLHKVVLVFELI